MTISLPPEIEGPLGEQARLQGTTPESLAIETLRRAFGPAEIRPPAEAEPPTKTERLLHDRLAPFIGAAEGTDDPQGGSLYDDLRDIIGSVSGTGESFSENCGERFTDALVEKKRRGHL